MLNLLLFVAATSFAQGQVSHDHPFGLAPFGQAPLPLIGLRRDYPLQVDFRYADAGRVDALAIVECLSAGNATIRSFDTERGATKPDRPNSWTEHVRVVASSDLSRGSSVDVVLPTAAPAFTMVPGRRYLLLAGRPEAGRLEIPVLGTYAGSISNSATEAEVAGLAAMETHADALDNAAKIEDRIAGSVMDCLAGSDDTGFSRTIEWLALVGDPGGGWRGNNRGREPFPLSQRLTAIAEAQAGYRRMRLFKVLCAWRVLGSEQPYVDSMIALAGETSYGDPRAASIPGDIEFGYTHRVNDPNYQPVKLDADRWADLIVGAKNDGVRGFLLMEVHRSPDEAHNRRIAEALLTDPHPNLLYAAIRHFALVLKHKEWMPEYRNVDGNATWVNRDSALREIRAHYGLAAP